MKIYNYDSDGLYVGQSEAAPSPREPGKFLIPARAVISPPPKFGSNEIPVWNGQAWYVKPDFRGRTGYDVRTGLEIEVAELGPWPSNLAHEPRPDQYHVWEAKSGAWKQDKAAKFKGDVEELEGRIDKRLDDFADQNGYRDMDRLASYAQDPDPVYAADAALGLERRSETWKAWFEILDSLTPNSAFPTWAEVEARLPVLAWPDHGHKG